MKKVKVSDFIIGTLVIFIIYAGTKIIFEEITYKLFNISEKEVIAQIFHSYQKTFSFYLINFLLIFTECGLIMYIHILFRPNFDNEIAETTNTVFVVGGLAFLIYGILMHNQIITFEYFSISLLFFYIEMPLAIFFGARCYDRRVKKRLAKSKQPE